VCELGVLRQRGGRVRASVYSVPDMKQRSLRPCNRFLPDSLWLPLSGVPEPSLNVTFIAREVAAFPPGAAPASVATPMAQEGDSNCNRVGHSCQNLGGERRKERKEGGFLRKRLLWMNMHLSAGPPLPGGSKSLPEESSAHPRAAAWAIHYCPPVQALRKSC
jgi:hypothetical protein